MPFVVSARSFTPGIQFLVQKRLTAGQAHLADSKPSRNMCNFQNLVIGQSLPSAQELIVLVELVFGHAVRTAKIALVQYRDPQVVERPAKCVTNNRNIVHSRFIRNWI
jgi:hypothetical protein